MGRGVRMRVPPIAAPRWPVGLSGGVASCSSCRGWRSPWRAPQAIQQGGGDFSVAAEDLGPFRESEVGEADACSCGHGGQRDGRVARRRCGRRTSPARPRNEQVDARAGLRCNRPRSRASQASMKCAPDRRPAKGDVTALATDRDARAVARWVLPRPDGADEQDVFSLRHPLAASQRPRSWPRHPRRWRNQTRRRLHLGEARLAQPLSDRGVVARDDLHGKHSCRCSS